MPDTSPRASRELIKILVQGLNLVPRGKCTSTISRALGSAAATKNDSDSEVLQKNIPRVSASGRKVIIDWNARTQSKLYVINGRNVVKGLWRFEATISGCEITAAALSVFIPSRNSVWWILLTCVFGYGHDHERWNHSLRKIPPDIEPLLVQPKTDGLELTCTYIRFGRIREHSLRCWGKFSEPHVSFYPWTWLQNNSYDPAINSTPPITKWVPSNYHELYQCTEIS